MLSFSTPPRLYVSLLLLLLCHSPVLSWPTRGTLTVTNIRAWDLKGDLVGLTEAYVKMWYGSHYYQTNIIRSNNPTWNKPYSMRNVDTNLGLRIEVWDKDVQYDDLLVSCEGAVRKGTQRFICSARRGSVEVRYTLT